jgi:hypothetical protein
LGCGCTFCNQVDKVLLDLKQERAEFSVDLGISQHIETQWFSSLSTVDASARRAQYYTYSNTRRGSPRPLSITKGHHAFDVKHSQWMAKAASMRDTLSALGSPDRLQALLGSCSEHNLSLKIVSLQRLPSGGMIADQYQVSMPIPIESRPALAPISVNSQPSPSDVAGVKRKAEEECETDEESAKRHEGLLDFDVFRAVYDTRLY